jgi:ADP-heptose:LPS heptosyltransferase
VKRLLRTIILLLVRLIGTPTTLLAPRRLPTDRAPRILLVRPDHLGDMLLVTPILHAIKACIPSAHITVMVGPWSAEVVARHPAINNLITCPFPGFQRASQGPLTPYQLLFTTAYHLRRTHYDLALNLRPDFWWGAALLYLAGIPQRIGYALAPGAPFLTQALPFPASEHATISNLRLTSAALQACGYHPLEEPYTPARYPLYFKPTDSEMQSIQNRLQHAGIGTETSLVVIHAGTGGAVKLWRNAGWSSTANWLCTKPIFTTPTHIVLTGSPKELPLMNAIAQEIQITPLLLTDLTVGELAALLKRANLVLGVDNGPLHLAVAQDTPSIRLYGPTDARIFGPWGDPSRHIVITSTHKCPDCPKIPCGRLDFSDAELPAHPCVRVISEQQIFLSIPNRT